MNRQLVDRLAPPVYAAVDFTVIVAPAVAVRVAAARGGMGDAHGNDLLIGSLVVGVAHAVVAGRRLHTEELIARRRADMWIAALNALVVLSLGATLMLIAVLNGFSEEHASLSNRRYPVIVLWVGIQLVAVALAEVTGWLVFRWLESDTDQRRSPEPGRPVDRAVL